jgi:hypothetical protein
MSALRAPRPTPARAAAILRRVFGGVGASLAFRLWDGSEVRVGPGAPPCTVVIHAPETFVRLLRDPRPLTFAEAYVESAIDLEGDLFAAMPVADALEGLRLPVSERLGILATLWKP